MTIIATALIALSLLAGPAIQAPEVALSYDSPTVSTRPAAAEDCMEDMPCWDCTAEDDRECVDGVPVEEAWEDPADDYASGIPGFTYGDLLEDAWESYGIADEGEWVTDEYTVSPNWTASYLGVEVPAYPADYFTIESEFTPGLFHVFHMVASQRV